MNPSKPFNGTIIRIPLQKDRTASKISNHTLSIEEAAAGVQSWAQKAGKSLLFLRHMTRLGLSMWRPNAITLTNLLEVVPVIYVPLLNYRLTHCNLSGVHFL